VIEVLLARLNLAEQVRFVPLRDDPRFHPGRAAMLERIQRQEKGAKRQAEQEQPKTQLGVLGELHPELRERLEIDLPRALAAELDLEALIGLAQPSRYRPISRFPAIAQDLAVVVGIEVPAAQLALAIRKYAGAELEALDLFDVYEGPQVGDGKRSLAYRLTFRAPDRTLSDADVSKVRAKIVRGLEFELKATIRG
jgi:phenylalanyl-tRNA synthetase beta chain